LILVLPGIFLIWSKLGRSLCLLLLRLHAYGHCYVWIDTLPLAFLAERTWSPWVNISAKMEFHHGDRVGVQMRGRRNHVCPIKGSQPMGTALSYLACLSRGGGQRQRTVWMMDTLSLTQMIQAWYPWGGFVYLKRRRELSRSALAHGKLPRVMKPLYLRI
jgi:hypothetical protein